MTRLARYVVALLDTAAGLLARAAGWLEWRCGVDYGASPAARTWPPLRVVA